MTKFLHEFFLLKKSAMKRRDYSYFHFFYNNHIKSHILFKYSEFNRGSSCCRKKCDSIKDLIILFWY